MRYPRFFEQGLRAAIEKEVADYIDERYDIVNENGRRLVFRNGSLPERAIVTGVGPVAVRQPRVRDKRPLHEREAFIPGVLPKYLRKTKSIEDMIPWLYLKGISTNDFPEALQSLLGPDARGLSPSTITRLKAVWEDEYDAWNRRSLVGQRHVYMWAYCIRSNVRFNNNEGRMKDENRQCLLVLMGATADGTKELVAIVDGHRESKISWKEVLLSLKARGLMHAPELAIGDGALGFWKALERRQHSFQSCRDCRCTDEPPRPCNDRFCRSRIRRSARWPPHENAREQRSADTDPAVVLHPT